MHLKSDQEAQVQECPRGPHVPISVHMNATYSKGAKKALGIKFFKNFCETDRFSHHLLITNKHLFCLKECPNIILISPYFRRFDLYEGASPPPTLPPPSALHDVV